MFRFWVRLVIIAIDVAMGEDSEGAKRATTLDSNSETAITKRSAEAGGQISPRGFVHPILNGFLISL